MPYTVTLEDMLALQADAAVLCVENPVIPADGPVCRRLAEAGGEALRQALKKQRFLSVGRAAEAEPCGLPFSRLILTAAPRWQNGEASELTVLHRCYQSVFDLAERLGCERLAMPFLSANYYRFPQEDAIHIAFSEAEKRQLHILFLAETPERFALSRQAYRKPEILSYVGYYRDHAVFQLDNGFFAHVDLRPEVRQVTLRSYFDPCYRAETDPARQPLPEEELARLRGIYESSSW